MKLSTKLLLAAVGAAAFLPAPAAAQRGWVLLGAREVSDRVDRDVIRPRVWRPFRQVRFCVQRNVIRFYDADVRFRNGGNQDVSLRSRIPAGGCTRVIDLRGRNRGIESVAFTYEAASLGRGRAVVRVFAR